MNENAILGPNGALFIIQTNAEFRSVPGNLLHAEFPATTTTAAVAELLPTVAAIAAVGSAAGLVKASEMLVSNRAKVYSAVNTFRAELVNSIPEEDVNALDFYPYGIGTYLHACRDSMQ